MRVFFLFTVFLLSSTIVAQDSSNKPGTVFLEFVDSKTNLKYEVILQPIEDLNNLTDDTLASYHMFASSDKTNPIDIFQIDSSQKNSADLSQFAEKLGFSENEVVRFDKVEAAKEIGMQFTDSQKALINKAAKSSKYWSYFNNQLLKRGLMTTIKVFSYGSLVAISTSIGQGLGLNDLLPVFSSWASLSDTAKSTIEFTLKMSVLGGVTTFFYDELGDLFGTMKYEKKALNGTKRIFNNALNNFRKNNPKIIEKITGPFPKASGAYGAFKWGLIETSFVIAATGAAYHSGILHDLTLVEILKADALLILASTWSQGDLDGQAVRVKNETLHELTKDFESKLKLHYGDIKGDELLKIIEGRASFIYHLKVIAGSTLWAVSNVLGKLGFAPAFFATHGLIKAGAILQYDKARKRKIINNHKSLRSLKRTYIKKPLIRVESLKRKLDDKVFEATESFSKYIENLKSKFRRDKSCSQLLTSFLSL